MMKRIMSFYPKREDMRTAMYYTICLTFLTCVLVVVQSKEHEKTSITLQAVVLWVMLIQVGMYCSGIFFGIVIARMSRQIEDEEKNKKLQESNTNKQGLTEPLCETGYQRV
jgi:hypothetical protein